MQCSLIHSALAAVSNIIEKSFYLIRLLPFLKATESPTATVTAAKANAVSFHTSQTRTKY